MGVAVLASAPASRSRHRSQGRVPHAFAIAPPAALDLDADNDALAQRLVTSVVLEDDVVPRLSLRSVDELVDKVACGGNVLLVASA